MLRVMPQDLCVATKKAHILCENVRHEMQTWRLNVHEFNEREQSLGRQANTLWSRLACAALNVLNEVGHSSDRNAIQLAVDLSAAKNPCARACCQQGCKKILIGFEWGELACEDVPHTWDKEKKRRSA